MITSMAGFPIGGAPAAPASKTNQEPTPSMGAAAPALLASLREITDAYLSMHGGEETFIAARALAAIAKAEGR